MLNKIVDVKFEEATLFVQDGTSDKVYHCWATLFLQDGTSDKVYHCWCIRDKELTDNGFSVHFEYGRRGGTMTRGTKITGTTSMYARKVFNDLVASKKKKGYKEEGIVDAFGKLDEKAATPKQIAVLKASGLVVPPGLSKQQASWMIDNSATALKKIAEKAAKPKHDVWPEKAQKIAHGVWPEKAQPIEVVWPTTNQYAPKGVAPKSEFGPTTRRIKEMDE
jgi:predicted DNA-binding WGR domain protein